MEITKLAFTNKNVLSYSSTFIDKSFNLTNYLWSKYLPSQRFNLRLNNLFINPIFYLIVSNYIYHIYYLPFPLIIKYIYYH